MSGSRTPLNWLIRFCLERKLIVFLGVAVVFVWGLIVSPLDWALPGVPRDPVPVDAIPDIGENEQRVFAAWAGRSPKDVDDRVSYPLTLAMLGIPGVKSVRSQSSFGYAAVSVLFDEDVEYYWSRSRIHETLGSLPPRALPDGVEPALGPDATPLGQVFWYTLEGQGVRGRSAGGWDPHELRFVQDWTVRPALLAVDGVAEVASVGGFEQEYQIDIDPTALLAHGIELEDVFDAVHDSNVDASARTIEVNRAEYTVRGSGFIDSLEDIESIVVAAHHDVPVLVRDVAHVGLGPATRHGVLDKTGAEAVGGVVVVRHGANPLQVIEAVRDRIRQLESDMPRRVLADGSVSQVAIVPFYDRSRLIRETLGTLDSTLKQEMLVIFLVVLLLVLHLRGSLLISCVLPLAVLATFLAMKVFGVDASLVALAGIAIAVGTIVDMGIVLSENILKRLEEAGEDESRLEVVYHASTEVGGAVLVAATTTVVSFLPVLALVGPEGRLFRPLAWTKTFALIAAVIIALTVIPPLAHVLCGRRVRVPARLAGRLAGVARAAWWACVVVATTVLLILLGTGWEPLGPSGGAGNLLVTVGLVAVILLPLVLFMKVYPALLRWSLRNKVATVLAVGLFMVCGATAWLGFDRCFGWLPQTLRSTDIGVTLDRTAPGLGREFMPTLDEGAFLYMPETASHASVGEAIDSLQKLDMAVAAVPEVRQVVGKIGRAETALDAASLSTIETMITYAPEYGRDDDGKRRRLWRDHVRSPEDIWREIAAAAKLPGVTSAPMLQPIETRMVMLQSGLRAPMGIKVFGPDLATIEAFGLELAVHLKAVPQVEARTVRADRLTGKPYLEIDIDRQRVATCGINVRDVQDVIEVAIGGKHLTTAVAGREQYPVRVRYLREIGDEIESLGEILVPSMDGRRVPLSELSEIRYARGPRVITSEDTVPVGHVQFDKRPGVSEVDAVEATRQTLEGSIAAGELIVPDGVTWTLVGAYENQLRAGRKLRLILPLALVIIFLILYIQFRSAVTALIVFSGVFVAWSGGFLLLWLYGQPWFLDVTLLGTNLRELFQVRPVNLSVAVWVGFLALFGIATDNGVVMATLLRQRLPHGNNATTDALRAATIEAARRRCRACVLTTATTVIALVPIVTSHGRGADLMMPMALPGIGGMLASLLTLFLVPVMYCGVEEWRRRPVSVPE